MFRPVNDKHSIQEVHFVLETEQHWIQEDKGRRSRHRDRGHE